MGLERFIETGLPVFRVGDVLCPGHQETAEILNRHPTVSVGIHSALAQLGIRVAELGALLDMNGDQPLPEMREKVVEENWIRSRHRGFARSSSCATSG